MQSPFAYSHSASPPLRWFRTFLLGALAFFMALGGLAAVVVPFVFSPSCLSATASASTHRRCSWGIDKDPRRIEQIDEDVLHRELMRMRDAKATFLQARREWVADERERFASAAVQGCAPHAFVDRSEWLPAFL